MPKILVTGATGMVGRFVVPALQTYGFQVRGQYARAPGSDTDVEWRQMDFLETLDFGQIVDRCDGIVHLAAELSDVSRMDRVNVAATAALVRAAEAAAIQYFGHASSVVVYGSPRQRFVNEETPLLDPHAPIRPQYHAEPYMLDYARTKTLGELAIRDRAPRLRVDLLRPTVIVTPSRLLEAGNWSVLHKFGAANRKTQYISATDAAAAIAHLVKRGLESGSSAIGIEPFNICDDSCGTYRDLLRIAYRATGDPRYRIAFNLPVAMDLAKDVVKYRSFALRYPLGMLDVSNARLRATGFVFPTGIPKAIREAIADAARRGRVDA